MIRKNTVILLLKLTVFSDNETNNILSKKQVSTKTCKRNYFSLNMLYIKFL